MTEWISVKDRYPDGRGAIVKVKRENGEERKVYYWSDGMLWLGFYGIRTTRFQDVETTNFLHDVTHWKIHD